MNPCLKRINYEYKYNPSKYNVEKFKEALKLYEFENIKNGIAFGCFSNVDVSKAMNVEEITHVIDSLEIKESSVIMVVNILDTPKGREYLSTADNIPLKLKVRGWTNDDGVVVIGSFAIDFAEAD